MIHHKRFPILVVLIACLSQMSGCGKKSPELVTAKGVVTIGGKPAANISVQFLPDVGEDRDGVWPTSYAITSDDGTFELRTADGQAGAVPGRHKLILVDVDEERPAQGQERTRPIRLDARYAIAGTVTAIVEADQLIEIVIP
jgi:hypothetical protein